MRDSYRLSNAPSPSPTSLPFSIGLGFGLLIVWSASDTARARLRTSGFVAASARMMSPFRIGCESPCTLSSLSPASLISSPSLPWSGSLTGFGELDRLRFPPPQSTPNVPELALGKPALSSPILLKLHEAVTVGVALLLDDIIDIADPGRGLGLGLGGASLPSSLVSSSSHVITLALAPLILLLPVSLLFPAYAILPGKTPSSGAMSISAGKNRKAFALPVPVADVGVGMARGVRPAASTFFRALIPMQSTSCRIASLSDTVRRGAVRRSVLARGRVDIPLCGVWREGRRGVVNG